MYDKVKRYTDSAARTLKSNLMDTIKNFTFAKHETANSVVDQNNNFNNNVRISKNVFL